MEKLTINGPFSIAMLVYQRVIYIYEWVNIRMIHQPEIFVFIGIIPPTMLPVRESSEVVIRDQIYPYNIYI